MSRSYACFRDEHVFLLHLGELGSWMHNAQQLAHSLGHLLICCKQQKWWWYFCFLHPLNYLHAPNIPGGILFLKANSWFPQGNENAGGVVLRMRGILWHALCPPPLLRSDTVLSITWWGSHVKTYKINLNLINYPSDNSLAASFFTPSHLRDFLQSLL